MSSGVIGDDFRMRVWDGIAWHIVAVFFFGYLVRTRLAEFAGRHVEWVLCSGWARACGALCKKSALENRKRVGGISSCPCGNLHMGPGGEHSTPEKNSRIDLI